MILRKEYGWDGKITKTAVPELDAVYLNENKSPHSHAEFCLCLYDVDVMDVIGRVQLDVQRSKLMETKERVNTNRNQFLDFLKGLGCIGVVFIHIRFPGVMGQVISKVSQFAVPVFFMITGYYALECPHTIIKRRLIKTLGIFFYGYFFFLIYSIAFALKNGVLVDWLKANYTWKALVKSVFFCTIDFAIPLWYLIAMLETYILWYFAVKSKRQKQLVDMMPMLFALQIVLTVVCETNDFAWFWKINFLTQALPWFLFGYYVHGHEKEEIWMKRHGKVLAVCAAVGCIAAIVPVVLDMPFDFSCIGILFYSASLFLIAVYYYDMPIYEPIAYIGNKLSRNVYIFHVLVAGGLSFGFHHILNIDVEGDFFKWTKPIMTVAATIILSWMIYSVSLYLQKHNVLKI